MLSEFDKSNEEIRSLNNEKAFLKNKINEVLQRNGFSIEHLQDPTSAAVAAAGLSNEAASAIDAVSKIEEKEEKQTMQIE